MGIRNYLTFMSKHPSGLTGWYISVKDVCVRPADRGVDHCNEVVRMLMFQSPEISSLQSNHHQDPISFARLTLHDRIRRLLNLRHRSVLQGNFAVTLIYESLHFSNILNVKPC